MAIHAISIRVDQYRGAYDDSENITVEMDDEEIEEHGRRVFINQIQKTGESVTKNVIFIDGKDALENMITAFQFILKQKGWEKEDLF